MIKFAAKSKKWGLLLGFGLSAGNIERLTQGKPILINLTEMGVMQGEILIFYGKDEAEMAKMIEPYIGPETKVHGDPPQGEGHGNQD